MKGSPLKQAHLSYKNAARCIVSKCKMNKEVKGNVIICDFFASHISLIILFAVKNIVILMYFLLSDTTERQQEPKKKKM